MKKLINETGELKDFQINRGARGGSSRPTEGSQRERRQAMQNLNVMTIELENGQHLKLFQSPAGIGPTIQDLTVVVYGGPQQRDHLLYAVDCTTRQRWGLNPRQVKALVDAGHMSPNQLKSTPIIIGLQAIDGLQEFKKYAGNSVLKEISAKIREVI